MSAAEERCARCGKLAEGRAWIGDERFCHPDDPNAVDCYGYEQWDRLRRHSIGCDWPAPWGDR